MNRGMKVGTKIVRWTDRERISVVVRTVELLQSGKFKSFIPAVQQAILDRLPAHRQRKADYPSSLGAAFSNDLEAARNMSTEKLARYAKKNGVPYDDDGALRSNSQEAAVKEAATTVPDLSLTEDTFDAGTAIPSTATSPIKEAADKELGPIAIQINTGLASPHTPAELGLVGAVQNYLKALLRPAVEQAVEDLRTNVIVPMLQEAIRAQFTLSLDTVLVEATERLTSQINTTMDQLTTPANGPAAPATPSIDLGYSEPVLDPETASPHVSGFLKGSNIRIFGLMPSQFEAVRLRLRNESWSRDLDVSCTKDLTELHKDINSKSHVIHIIKFSSHLPASFRSKVARIYPDAKGIGAITELIKNIVEGKTFIPSY